MSLVFNPFTGTFDFTGGGGGTATTPALPFQSIQYNNAGAFGGSADLLWDGTLGLKDLKHFVVGSVGSFTPNGIAAVIGIDEIGPASGDDIAGLDIKMVPDNTANSSQTVYGQNGTITSTGTTHDFNALIGWQIDVAHAGTGDVAILKGFHNVVQVTGGAVTAFVEGIEAGIDYSYTGAHLPAGYGGYLFVNIGAGAVVDDGYGFWIDKSGSGTAGAYRALFITDISGFGGTPNRAIDYANKFVVDGTGNIRLSDGLALSSDTTTAHTALLQAYDVDGAAYKTFATLTNANTPTFVITPPSGGTVTVNATTLQQGGSTLTLGGALTTSGAFASTFTMTNTTGVTFPTSGTLATTSQIPSGAALTKGDDTNVTLTLGGSASTALVNAASIAAGWAGTLSVARGGSGAGTLTGLVLGNGTSAFTTVTAPSGTVVGTSDTQTLTNKRITKRVTTASDATSITPNSDNADITYQANTQAVGTLTINADGGTPTNGQGWVLKIKSTNVQTFSWNAIYVGGAVPLPTTTSGSSKIDYFAFVYDTVTPKWDYTGPALGY